MIDALARAIDELETRRDRMMAEYRQIEEALAAMRRIGTDDEHIAPPPDKADRPRGQRPPAPSLVHHNRDQERTARILTLLAAGPQPTRVIAQKLGQDRKVMKQALRRLRRAGHLIAVGQSRGARWALPTKRPAAAAAPASSKEAPH